jgi:hypothetical protein
MITVSLLPSFTTSMLQPAALATFANLPPACECASSSQLASAAGNCIYSACGNNVNLAQGVMSSARAVCACATSAAAAATGIAPAAIGIAPAAIGIAGRVTIATAAV